jgi:hypothetical protein
MPKSHKRQRRPLFPAAWTPNALADSLHVDRGLIYSALSKGDLIAYRVTGKRSFILTGSADEPGSVVAWIKSHRKVKS